MQQEMSEVAIGSRCIETACGLFIDPLDPDPAMFRLYDIAHALSNVCRFQGHSRRHYSVAEHSMHVAALLSKQEFDRRMVLTGLMHDSSEAYICDLSAPLKHDIFGDRYREIEAVVMSRLAERFGFTWPLPQEVHEADKIVLWCEAHELMHSYGKTWGNYESTGREIIDGHQDVCSWIAEEGLPSTFSRDKASMWHSWVLGAGAK